MLLGLAAAPALLSVAATNSDQPVDTTLLETMSTMHGAMHRAQLTGEPDGDLLGLHVKL